MLGFAKQEGKTKRWVAYLVVLVAGEGPEEDLGTWGGSDGPPVVVTRERGERARLRAR
jgi:hypothetical protein